MAKFPFNDLHSFKDYVGFVKLCAPDLFPPREGVGQEDQWTLELAFLGLRKGLVLVTAKEADGPVLEELKVLIEEAYSAYAAGHFREGYLKLDEVSKRLKKIPTQ